MLGRTHRKIVGSFTISALSVLLQFPGEEKRCVGGVLDLRPSSSWGFLYDDFHNSDLSIWMDV
jgi:hypothetical protein